MVDASDYRGLKNTTSSGKTCQKWTSQTPHSHTRGPENYPDSGLGDHNFCRNPDGELTAWCYTTDSSSRFELCDIGLPGDHCGTALFYGTVVEVCAATHLCQPNNRCGDAPSDAEECGCDSACEYYGDCCYDYWSVCNSPEPNPSAATFDSEFKCMTGDGYFKEGYYTVSYCGDDSTVDVDTIDKCENPGSGDILLTILVSDTNDNIYKNVYCALCNGVPISDVTAWEVTFLCRDDDVREEFGVGPQPGPQPAPAPPPLPFPFTTLEPTTTKAPPPNIHEQVGNTLSCPYESFRPPPGKQDTRRPCNSAARSECNENYLNESVINACLSNYKAIVYDDKVVYRNPNCAICNSVPFYTCENIYPATRPFGFTPLTVIVDFSDQSSISVNSDYGSYVTEGIDCPTDEVFDPFTKQCLKVTCKSGFILQDSKCVAPLKTSGCGDSAFQMPSGIFCLCKLEEHSLTIDYHYKVKENDVTVDGFTEDLEFLGVQYTRQSSKRTSTTIITISINAINCQLAYAISELVVRRINNTYDTQLNLVTVTQNCSTIALPSELHCDFDDVLLKEEELHFDNITRTVHVDNSSVTFPDDKYIMEIAIHIWNESYTCTTLSLSTCEVCPQISLNESAFLDQGNGALVHELTGNIFKENQYYLEDPSNTSIIVCSFLNKSGSNMVQTQFFNYSGALLIVSVTGTILSLIGLLITILLRVFIKELRTLSGKIILNVSIALFCALLLTVIQSNFIKWLNGCRTVAAVLHYLWLVCFLWMNAMAFELFRTFRFFRASSRSKGSQKKSFILYFTSSWGIPAVYVGAIVAISLCECTRLNVVYGDGTVCWIRDELASFYVFGIPIAVIILPNLILFVATITGIREARQSTAIVSGDKSKQKQLAEEMIIYIRISTVMGLTWIFGFLASFIDHVVLWYLFTILNSLQGFFIFIAFNLTYSMKNILATRRKKPTSSLPKTKETLVLQASKNRNSESEPLQSSRL
ncbi:uncharacterized protein LOC117106729 isoform X2 [Anneissia japonica]|nr:uncharacterized protein LOC117106729 isoform X2 [Anneissia japonica]